MQISKGGTTIIATLNYCMVSRESGRVRQTFKYHIISRTELLLNCCSMDFLGCKQFKTFYLLKAQTGKSEWHEVKIVILKKSCNLYLIQAPHALQHVKSKASFNYFSKKRIYQVLFEVLLDKENHIHRDSS